MMTRAELDARAEALGINPSPRWKDETVAEKIAEAEAALAAKEAARQPDPLPAAITVTGPKRGRWRAGRHFTPEPVTIPLGDLNDDEVAQLTGDPYLTVSGLPQD